MKILMIGGTGLVGPYVIQEIYGNISEVEITTVTRSGKNILTETALKCDRNDSDSFEAILKNVDPDVLIDMIPFTVEDITKTTKIIQKINPLLRVIVISSIDVYAAYAKLHSTENIDFQKCPIKENMALRSTLGAEGRKYDKLNVERLYLENLQNVTVLRIPATYGWPDIRRVKGYLDPMLQGEKLLEIDRTKANWKFSRCLHKNAAFAVLKTIIASQTGHHFYNVAEEKPYTDLEWCQKIAIFCGWKGNIVLTDNENKSPNYEQHLHVSTAKIRVEIGFHEKYDPDEGLMEAVKLYSYNQLQVSYKPCY